MNNLPLFSKVTKSVDLSSIRSYFSDYLNKKMTEKFADDRKHDFCIVDINEILKFRELSDLFSFYNIKLKFCMGFWCMPFSRGYIHQDLDNYALNIPICSNKGHQVWTKNHSVIPNYTYYGGTSSKAFGIFPMDTNFDIVDKLQLDYMYFVNTGIYHYIDNLDNSELRMILTLRFVEPEVDFINCTRCD